MRNISDLINLGDSRVIITGANGCIGKEIALTIAELGGDLILVDYPGTNYSEIKNKITDTWDVRVDIIDCDLESENDRNRLIESVSKDGFGLDVLINNAAFVGDSNLKGWVTDFENQSVETWRRAIEVNLTSVFHLSQGFFPLLEKSKIASIINIGSIYAINGPDYSLYSGTNMGNPAAYSASKGGLIQLTRWLSTTLAPNIRVNAISPGGVIRDQPIDFIERYNSRTPLGRMATEEDFKGVIAFLASNLSSYMTGQNLLIDGGWTTW